MQDARRHQPASAGLQVVGLGVIEDAVVAFVPAIQAADDVLFGRTRFEAEKSVREVVADGVELRWKVIGLGFALLADEFGLGVVLVHVVWDRPEVVEKLGVNRPPLVLVPERFADQALAFEANGV